MNEKFKELLEENPYLFYNVYCQGELYERTELSHHNCEYCGWNGSRGGATLDVLLKELTESAIEDMLWESIYAMNNPYSIEVRDIFYSVRYVTDDDASVTIEKIITDIISEKIELDVDINIEDEIYYLHNKDIDINLVRNILESMIE